MADEVQVQIMVDAPPAHVMEEWRQAPPEPLTEFELEDSSFNSLSFVKRYYDWPQKILIVTTLGFALIFRAFLLSTFRLTARFDEDGPRTKVTVVGHAHPRMRQQLADLAAANGGPVGMAIGV